PKLSEARPVHSTLLSPYKNPSGLRRIDFSDPRVSSRRRRRRRRCCRRLRRRDHAVPQDLPDQEEAGQEDAPEPPHPLLDPHAHRQHHQVQREAQALAPHQARILSGGRKRCRASMLGEARAYEPSAS
ncbi:hypothetical protein U9M48_029543, partial [Paspalum notatum var. saurae]